MLKPAATTERMTEAEFFDWLDTQEEKHELVDGQVVAMAGGTVVHGRVARNLIQALGPALKGTGCETLGSDVAVRTGPRTLRYPDVHVYCGLDTSVDLEKALDSPKLVIEVFSPSTWRGDKNLKSLEYKRLDSVQAIVLVEPRTRVLDVYERVGPAEWRNVTLLPGADLVLRDPALTLTAAEIFGEAAASSPAPG